MAAAARLTYDIITSGGALNPYYISEPGSREAELGSSILLAPNVAPLKSAHEARNKAKRKKRPRRSSNSARRAYKARKLKTRRLNLTLFSFHASALADQNQEVEKSRLRFAAAAAWINNKSICAAPSSSLRAASNGSRRRIFRAHFGAQRNKAAAAHHQ